MGKFMRKVAFDHVLGTYKDTFSLRVEIGLTTNMEVELKLTEACPFFIQPFFVKDIMHNVHNV